MFTPEFFIDTFQETKKILTHRVFTDKIVNKACINFIDAQTAFAKMLMQNTVDLSKYAVDSFAENFFFAKVDKTK